MDVQQHTQDGRKVIRVVLRDQTAARPLASSIELDSDWKQMRRGVYMVPNHVDRGMAERLVEIGVARKVMPRIETKNVTHRPAPV